MSNSRLPTLLLAAALALSACGDDPVPGSAKDSKSAESTTIATTTTAPGTTIATTTTASTTTTTAAPTTTTTAVPTGDAFYTPPSPLPSGKPGDIIWQSAPVAGALDSKVSKILYLSTTARGAPVAVSGLMWVPKDVKPDATVVSYAHGTTGLADRCAPSKKLDNGESSTVAEGLLPKGWIVVATDYEGLGTPGVHPYVVGRSEGPNVLDAIRAARHATKTSGKSLVWGHSQGGGSALWAAQLAPTYASDANVVGSVAGAPAVELKLLATALRTSPFFGYIFMASAGFQAAYPELAPRQAEALTDKGIEATKKAAESCGEVVAELNGKPADDYLKVDPSTIEPFGSLLEDNTPGNFATTVPIFVYHGENDEQIPVIGSQLYFNRVCKTGGTAVLRTTYPGESHVSVIARAQGDITGFMQDRLDGKPFVATPCPTT
jgi:pimeloyl-ACP methyl ester carboxylesterase